MRRIIFLVEEPSMEAFLGAFLPRIFDDKDSYLCISHEGKNDLIRSIPRKLRAWRESEAVFVLLMDNDNRNCAVLRKELEDLCAQAGREDACIRLVIQELESWFLGNLEAVESAGLGKKLSQMQFRNRYRNPDSIPKPSEVLGRLVKGYKKIDGARRIAQHITFELKQNRSKSYNKFLQTLLELLKDRV